MTGESKARIRFFAVEKFRHEAPDQAEPLVVIEPVRWDDFSFKTTFCLWFSVEGEQHRIGEWKILDVTREGRGATQLPVGSRIRELPTRYRSLGQDVESYRRLRRLVGTHYEAILRGLRDVAYLGVDDALRDHEGFALSLTRFGDAQRVLEVAPGTSTLRPGLPKLPPPPPFRFTCRLEGFEADHRLDLDFTHWDSKTGLGRVRALIGPNGAGKTRLLNRLALAIGMSVDTPSEADEPSTLTPRPAFSRTIAISFSAFDPFRRPASNRKTGSYVYCGLRDRAGKVDMKIALADLHEAVHEVRDDEERRDLWWRALEDAGLHDAEPTLGRLLSETDARRAISVLSSGNKIMLHVLTHLVVNLRQQSLVLVDEPELHLHPRLLSALMRAFHDLAERFDSYVLLATHSPVVLQGLLAASIHIVTVDNRRPSIRPIRGPTFGANLSDLAEAAFGPDPRELNWIRALDRLLLEKRREAVEEIIGTPKSLAVRMHLDALEVDP